MRGIPLRKVLLITWACALVFGLTFQASKVEAMHSSCSQTCADECGGSCGSAYQVGDCCFYRCAGGGGGSVCDV